MTDRLSIYNGALRKVQERKLASLTENREPRRLLDDIWDDGGIKACLEAGQWTFATRKVKIEASAPVSPEFGWDYAYEPPTDFVRLVGVSDNGDMTRPLTRYEFTGGLLFANYQEIFIAYVSDDPAYGNDYSLWPESFNEYVEYHFAVEVAPRLTTSESKVQSLMQKRDDALNNALSIDAQKLPSKLPPLGNWASARLAGGYSRRSYNGRY
jgi:hypothetical protein